MRLNGLLVAQTVLHWALNFLREVYCIFLCMCCASCIQFLFQPTMHNMQVFYFNNIYSIIAFTCFDTLVSSSGSSKVVLRLSYVVSVALKFH
jgi:hypothetical protein